jgi:integrase
MPKIAKPLGALAVKNLKAEGLHAVGTVSGLHLSISASGARSWILRTKIGTRRSDIGLGAYPAVSLALAHEKAQATKESIKQGIDPVAARTRNRSTVEWTFERCALEYIKLHRASWKGAKHASQWENTLATYAYPKIGAKHVRDIAVGDVLAVIESHWLTKNETMVRVRNRIELVLSWAAVRGYRSKENPAAWKGNLAGTLPKPSKVNQHEAHKALPFTQAHDFMVQLRQTAGTGAKCLQWLILTATRSNEARGATWSEIDLQNAAWTIPAARMKAGREHRIPLSPATLALLQSLSKFEGTDLVFPGRDVKKPLSDMSMTLVLRRMKVDAVPHGFRSTFVDWAAERTSYPVELREMALAHTLGDKTQAAYQRGDMFERRRALMSDWAAYIDTPPITGNIIQFKTA